MEDKLIVAVSSNPELYDVTSVNYENQGKDRAWQAITEEPGIPGKFKKVSWFNLFISERVGYSLS